MKCATATPMPEAPLQTLRVPFTFERPTPPFEGNDIRYPEALVRPFIQRFTKKGQRVFDPFAGLGTTLFVAEELDRTPYGIEADAKRHAWSAGQLEHWQNLLAGDAAQAGLYRLPKMDFCMTSPPFMPRHHKWNPLYAGNPKHAGYAAYLKRMGQVFKAVAGLMKRGAIVAVQADNLQHGRVYTPLVADLHANIAPHLEPAGETLVTWDPVKAGYPHTHVMLFRAR